MSVVSGLIDTDKFFKFKKIVVPTNATNNIAGEIDPIIDPRNAPFPMRKCRNYVSSYFDNALRVQGNPAQNLKDNNVVGYYNAAAEHHLVQTMAVMIADYYQIYYKMYLFLFKARP